ncbi:YueI family protein [Paucilactobacillus sp. N302-9]
MSEEQNQMDQHMQSAMYGTPEVNPDEQRKYLGTFRERVSLTITVGQLKSQDWQAAFKQEITTNPNYIAIFNGNIGSSLIKPYMHLATTQGVNFTLKTDPKYRVSDDNFGVVVTAKTAIHVSPVDVAKKYPAPIADTTTTPKKSFWQKLFK